MVALTCLITSMPGAGATTSVGSRQLTCGANGPSFPERLIKQPPLDLGTSRSALDRYAHENLSDYLDRDVRVVSDDGHFRTYLTGDTPDDAYVLQLNKLNKEVERWDSCEMGVLFQGIPAAREVAFASRPVPQTRSVTLFVFDRIGCGAKPEVISSVRELPSRIEVVVALRRKPIQAGVEPHCVGYPTPRTTIKLAAPLNDRPIVNVGQFTPTEIAETTSETR